MRLVTWNVDGLRAMLTRRQEPLSSVLSKLNADIVCLQETKLSKKDWESIRSLAVVTGWRSFFAVCRVRSNYAGAATFCRDTVPVHAAEEGLSGRGERGEAVCMPPSDAWQAFPVDSLQHNDDEGRCIITDHGAFILVHVYGPAVTDIAAERFPRKLVFYNSLQVRLQEWMKQGRHVIIAGDLNIAWQPIDNCDWADSKLPEEKLRQAFLEDRPDRAWFQNFLDPSRGSSPRDLLRNFHPRRRKAYTVWGRTFGKRERNYGSRVDYILAASPDSTDSKGIAERCTGCDIMTDWLGSDHAPVWASFDHSVWEGQARSADTESRLESKGRFASSGGQQTLTAAFGRSKGTKRKMQEDVYETPPRSETM